jgi:DNA mismatch endonuclease (patch repair protein)
MADVFTKAKRSAVMSLIRSRGNRATELRLIALMREHGITGWRRNAPVFGKPDFVFRRERVAVFVDGCFWHGCPRHATMPANNRTFWKAKLARNAARDRVWECALSRRRSGRTILRIAHALALDECKPHRNPAPVVKAKEVLPVSTKPSSPRL